MPVGIMTNFISIVAGGFLGALLGGKMPQKLNASLPLMFGFAAITMGVYLISKMHNLTIVVLSLLIGSSAGYMMNLEQRLHRAIQKLGAKLAIFKHTDEQREQYIMLLVMFCVGGTGVFGALMEGINGDSTVLLTKSTLDFFTAMIFASSLGFSVMLLGVFQLAIFLLLFSSAGMIAPMLTAAAISNFTAIGGVISMAIGFKMANIKHVEISNLLPAMVFVLVLSALL